jgi:hypothetical protein
MSAQEENIDETHDTANGGRLGRGSTLILRDAGRGGNASCLCWTFSNVSC